jgi:beta-lactamase superfamily II metal-dependent hydrolase
MSFGQTFGQVERRIAKSQWGAVRLSELQCSASEVIQRYEDERVEVLRTDNDGAISVIAGRNAYQLTTFRTK